MVAGSRSVSAVMSLIVLAYAAGVAAQVPDHPIISEVYTEPPGASDGPVGRDLANEHQEFIEIYVPPAANLNPIYNPNALNLTFYEVEGDKTSSGYTLVNYRIDIPTFARPASGVVVLGWVDYVGNPPTGLAGTPSTRLGLVNGGITAMPADYLFVAMNGGQFSGTTNFAVPLAISLIHMPNEASSGIIQGGSGAYLLVDRNDVGYVELYDDKDTAHVPPTANADPSLATGTVLQTSAMTDGFAVNDDDNGNGGFGFEVLLQPYSGGTDMDLSNVLPFGGPFSKLIAQVPEVEADGPDPGIANGYARVYVDVRKTTENLSSADDDPAQDALNAYRHIRNDGPFYPTPGSVVATTSPPELSLASDATKTYDILAGTTANVALRAANVGGDYPIDLSVSAGASSNPSVATFGGGADASAIAGQAYGLPELALTGQPSSPQGASASATVTVTASNSNVGDPAVLSPIQTRSVTATVLNPSTGLNAVGLPLQTTVFAAVQAVPSDTLVANEFVGTSLGQYLVAQPDVAALQTMGNAAALLNPFTDIRNAFVVGPMIKELPGDGDECIDWKNPPGPIGRLSFVDTVSSSAEAVGGTCSGGSTPGQPCDTTNMFACPGGTCVARTTYDASISVCLATAQSVIKAIRINVPDTLTFGGSFSPTESVSFSDAAGNVGDPASSLTDVATSRTFEIALIDTQVRANGTLESGQTDDFGIVVEVLETEPGSSVVPGEYVFVSLTGGFQGADIDGVDVPPGGNVATIVYLDLDNLHDFLGIRSIESLYIVDARAGGEVDFIEGFSLNPAGSFLASAVPATGESLWRTNQNTVRLTFATDITAPGAGEILIQPMLPGGSYGADISSGVAFTVENNLGGLPRILKIVDVDPPDLVHRQWYAIQSAGGWTGGGDFLVQYVVQVGDADNNGVVLNLDVGLVNAGIPNLGADDQDRRDIDGDATILNDDASTVNARIPSFRVLKPSGH